ncbi:phospholipase-like, aminotransferase-like mobile domain protein [Tanacetum coccineum]
MLQKQKLSDNDHYDLPLICNVNGHTLHFGLGEFCLITGFKFGFNSFRKFREGDISFRDRVFSEKIGEYVKSIDLLPVIEDEEHFTSLSDEESIRVCLLLSLEVIFMGHDLGYTVDDIWILESSSATNHWWRKLSEEIPRGRFWSKHFPFHNWEYFGQLFPQIGLSSGILETIINVITPKKATNVKRKVNTAGTKDKVESVGKQCDLGDKCWSDQDGNFLHILGCQIEHPTRMLSMNRYLLPLMVIEEYVGDELNGKGCKAWRARCSDKDGYLVSHGQGDDSASSTQRKVSSIPIVGSISLEGFLSLILLLVVIIATVVVTVVVVAIIGVVIVVAVIGVVAVVE